MSDIRQGPFYFKDDDDGKESVYNDDPENEVAGLLQTDDVDDNETQFFPASSQITIVQHGIPLGLYDSSIFKKPTESADAHIVLDESGELRLPSTQPNATAAFYNSPASNHSEQTSRAMKNVKVEDYLRLPSEMSRTGPVLLNARHPLNLAEDSKKRDTFFAGLYAVNIAIMLIIGVLVSLLFPSDIRDGILKSPTAYRVIMESVKGFVSAVSFSLILIVIWSVLLIRMTETVIYGMAAIIPGSCFFTTLWAVREYMHQEPSGSFGKAYLYAVALTSFVGAIGSFYVLNRSKKTIQTTISITKTSAQVLSENPSLFATSFLLMVGYFGFVLVWLGLFAHLLLLGHVVDGPLKYFKLSSWSYFLQAYFVSMLVWTTSNVSCLQKAMVSTVVSEWYFFRKDMAKSNSIPAFDGLLKTFNNYSGQICLAGLVMSLAKGLRVSFQLYKRATARFQSRLANIGASGINAVLTVFEKLIEHVSEFAIYYVPLSGESFCKSGRSSLRILKRNALVGFSTDLVANMIFTLSIVIVSVLTGLGSYTFASHVLKSEYGWASGVLFGMLSWYVLQLFADVYRDTMGVTFLCYAIDVDTEKVHCPAIHEAYSQHYDAL